MNRTRASLRSTRKQQFFIDFVNQVLFSMALALHYAGPISLAEPGKLERRHLQALAYTLTMLFYSLRSQAAAETWISTNNILGRANLLSI